MADTKVRFYGRPMHVAAEEMLGRVFDGLGNPIDGQPDPLPEDWADINGQPVNPTARLYPQDAILDRHLGDRWDEHAGIGPEATDLLGETVCPTTRLLPRSCARLGCSAAAATSSLPSSSQHWA